MTYHYNRLYNHQRLRWLICLLVHGKLTLAMARFMHVLAKAQTQLPKMEFVFTL